MHPTLPPRRGALDVDYGFVRDRDGHATWLAVGNACSRNSRRWTAVVTLCGQAELDNSRANYIEVCPPPTLMVPLDEMEGGASPHLPIILAFVQHYVRGDRPQVLVHCDAGIKRGPTVAAFLLMADQTARYSEEEAVAAVTQARPVAFPSPAILHEVRAHVDILRRLWDSQLQYLG